MKRLILIFVIVFGYIMSYGSSALKTAEFVEMLKSKTDLVVVDCDRPQNYAQSHLKGAINIWQQDLFVGKPDGILKSPQELTSFFGSKGINENTLVVLYDDGSNKYTSRVYFVLKMLGSQDVRILTKNMQEWSKYRLPLTTQPTTLPKTVFNSNLQPNMLITINDFKEKLQSGDFVLIDTRKPEEYAGQTEKSKGHLPGAINIDYREFLNKSNDFKSADELKSIPALRNLKNDQEIILYCNSGVLASVGYYALKDVLGFSNVRVLDGGYNHWVLDENNPVEK